MRSIPHDNLRYPVLITLNDALGSFGSGFFLQSLDKKDVFFITAKHVLFDLEKNGEVFNAKLKSTHATTVSYSGNLEVHEKITLEFDFEKLVSQNNLRAHETADVVVIKILSLSEGKVLTVDGVRYKEFQSKTHNILTVSTEHIKLYSEVSESNDVFLFGFPNSLGLKDIPQIEHDKPLLRRGVIAAKNDSKKSIILDCAVYPGNSGGPVTEVEMVDPYTYAYRVIGVVSEFVPFVQVWKNLQLGTLNRNIENSGYSVVVPMDFVLDTVKKFY